MGRKKNKGSKQKSSKIAPTQTVKDDVTTAGLADVKDSAGAGATKPAKHDYQDDVVTSHDSESQGHLSKRDEFERSRSNSSRHDSDSGSHDQSAASVTSDRHQNSALQDSVTSSATELTQEALNIHTQLLRADVDTPPTQSAAVSVAESSPAQKRCSLASTHDDVESGVGTFSVQSSDVMMHREDTFNIDEQEETSNIETRASQNDRTGESPKSTSSVPRDGICRKDPGNDIAEAGSSHSDDDQQNVSSHHLTSRDTAALTSSMSRDTESFNMGASQSLPFSTLSKTSTGFAFHSTGSEFALTTSQSINDDLNEDFVATTDSAQNAVAAEHLPADDICSPRDQSACSSPSREPASNSQSQAAEDDDASRKLSLDYDLESSVDSVRVTRFIKFSNPGPSLFDELQQCGRTSDTSSSKSATPVKSRPHQGHAPTKSTGKSEKHDACNDTLGSIDEQRDLGNNAGTLGENMENRVMSADDLEESLLSSSSVQHSKRDKSATSSIKEASSSSYVASALNDSTMPSEAASHKYERYYDQDSTADSSQHYQQTPVQAWVESGQVVDGQSTASSERLVQTGHSYSRESLFNTSMSNQSDPTADDNIVVRELPDSELSLNHSHTTQRSVDEILENREQVASTVACMNQEMETLRAENNQLYGEMTSYRKACKQYKHKVGELDGYLRALRQQVKAAEIKLAEVNTQRQSVTSTWSMTEHALLLNTAVQAEALSYNAETQITVPTINRACQMDGGDDDRAPLTVDKHTLTVETSGLPMAENPEKAEKKRDLAKASAMLEKILRPMNNIAGTTDEGETSVSQLLGNDTEPETSDKWRRLAMTAVSMEPEVLRLQRSLATAAMEYDILQTKIQKTTIEAGLKTEELTTKLRETTEALESGRHNSDDWRCRYEGDRAELEVLRDRVQSLEKQLLLNQMETDRLQDEVKVRTEVMESGDLVSREAMDRVRQERDDNEVKVTKLEQDKRQLHQDLCAVQESRSSDLEKLNQLENSVNTLQADKAVLQVDLNSLKEEYHHLQQGLSSVEKLFHLQPTAASSPETYSDLQHAAEKQIEQLKRHVFERKKKPEVKLNSDNSDAQAVTSAAVAEPATAVTSCSGGGSSATEGVQSGSQSQNSVHTEILKQSELILNVLRENGDIEDEVAFREVEQVNWRDVKDSITNHLRGETEEKVKAAIEESSEAPATDAANDENAESDSNAEQRNDVTLVKDSDLDDAYVDDNDDAADFPLSARDLDVKSQLSELASALSSDLGFRISLTVDTPRQSEPPPLPVNASTPVSGRKAKQMMELEMMNRDYEELRKKRLSLLVQAYTGNTTGNTAGQRSYRPSADSMARSLEMAKSDLDATATTPTRPEAEVEDDDAMAAYDRETAKLRERIRAFREEIRRDRTGYVSYNGYEDGSPHYYDSVPGMSSTSMRDSVFTYSKQGADADTPTRHHQKVPRVCVAASGRDAVRERKRQQQQNDPDLRSALTSVSCDPHDFRQMRHSLPRKAEFGSMEDIYERSKPRHRRQQQQQFTHDYDNNSDYSQNNGYYGDQAYPERDVYDDGYYYDDQYHNGYDDYEDDYERYADDVTRCDTEEAFYDKQKRVNAKAIERMKEKLRQNNRRIAMEQAKLAAKQQQQQHQQAFETADHPARVKRSQQKQSFEKHEDLDKDRYRSVQENDRRPEKDDQLSRAGQRQVTTVEPVRSKFDQHAEALRQIEERQNHYRMSFHKDIPFEVDLASFPSSFSTAHAHDSADAADDIRHKEDDSRYRTDEVVSAAETQRRAQELVEKYTGKKSSTKRDHSAPSAYESYHRSGDKWPSTVSKSSSRDVNKLPTHTTSTATACNTSPKDLLRNENYDSFDASRGKASYNRGKDSFKPSNSSYITDRFSDNSVIASFMELPSRLASNDKVTSQLDTIGQAISSSGKRTTSTKDPTKKEVYKSPYDKYDVITENNETRIIPKHHSYDRPSADKRDSQAKDASGKTQQPTGESLQLRKSKSSYTRGHAAATADYEMYSHNRGDLQTASYKPSDLPKDSRHTFKQRDVSQPVTSRTDVPSTEQSADRALRSTSASRSRDSSPVRRHDMDRKTATEYSQHEKKAGKYDAGMATGEKRRAGVETDRYESSSSKAASSSRQAHRLEPDGSQHTTDRKYTAGYAAGSSQSKRKEPEGRHHHDRGDSRADKHRPSVQQKLKSYDDRTVIEPFRLPPTRTEEENKYKYTDAHRTATLEQHRGRYDKALPQSSSMDKLKTTASKSYVKSSGMGSSGADSYKKYDAYVPAQKYVKDPKTTSTAATTSTLNSQNLESLNRENGTKIPTQEPRGNAHLTTQRSLPEDVSSVAGSSDADFVVTATGDILKRKSRTAKTIDKARNAELQMRSFDTPYEEFEDEWQRRRASGDADLDLDDVTVPDQPANDSQYWSEPKRHFGLKTDNPGRAQSKLASDTQSTRTHSIPDDRFSTGVGEQKWFRNPDVTQSDRDDNSVTNLDDDNTMSIDKAKTTLRQRPDCKERSQYYAHVTETRPTQLETLQTVDSRWLETKTMEKSHRISDPPTKSTRTDTINAKYSTGDTGTKLSSVLFDTVSRDVDNAERSQRRVHWETPHARVKPGTPDTDVVTRPSTASLSATPDCNTGDEDASRDDSSKSTVVTEVLQEARKEYELNSKLNSDWSSRVSEMKEASGLYEVPRLSKTPADDNDEKTSKTSDESSESTPRNDVMFLPKDSLNRQKIADDIVTKYLQDYDIDSQLIPERDVNSAATKSTDDVILTKVDDYKPPQPMSPSRIPIKAKETQYTTAVRQRDFSPSNYKSASSIPVRNPSTPLTPRTDDVFSYDDSGQTLSQSRLVTDDVLLQLHDVNAPAVKKTSIPVRHGSTVEDRYRRDRSTSRDSRSTSRDSRSTVDIEEILSRYAAKSRANNDS